MQDVVDALPEPLLVLDEDLRVERANEAFVARFELDAASAIGASVHSLGGGAWDIPELRHLLEDRLVHESSVDGALIQHVFKDLGRRVLRVNARRLEGMRRILLGIQDVTRQYEAEQAVRDSEARLRLLALVTDHSPDFIAISDVEGELLFVNDAAVELMGAPAHRVLELTLPDYFVPEEQAFIRSTVLPAIHRRGSWTGELHLRHAATFEAIPVLYTGFRVDDPDTGEVMALAVLIRDLTAQKRAAQKMEEKESRFRAMAELSPAAIMVADRGRWVFANEAAAKLLGARSTGDVVGRSPLDFIDREHHAFVNAAIADVLEHQRATDRVASQWKRVDGSLVDVEVIAGPIEWRNHRAVQVVALDVTARQQVERQLEEANRNKDEYLAMLGHELRNPLAAIRNAARLLEYAEVEDPRMSRAVDVLRRQSFHMARIIDGLLEVSRIARGKVEVTLRPVELRDVVAGVVEDRKEEIADKGLRIKREFRADDLWIDGDAIRLSQVFDNLLGNAIKFTPAPGTIVVACERRNGSARVRVRDTGIGIRRQVLSRIFDAFHQEAQGVARSVGGLGLGLSLAKSLVSLHDGEIYARSEGPGKGAEFEVSLPLLEREPRSRAR